MLAMKFFTLTLLLVAAAVADPTTNPPFQAPPFNRGTSGGGRRRGRNRGPEPDSLVGHSEGNPRGVVLTDVELEPGIHNDTSQVSDSYNQPTSTEQGERTSDDIPGRAVLLLQRLNDRLTALHALDEQQLRRLETLEYRLTKMEVQSQEKSDGIKGVLSDVNRKVQELDWQINKLDTLFEGVRQDLTTLKQGQNEIRQTTGPSRSSGAEPGVAEAELLGKMQMIMASLFSVRGVVGILQDDMKAVKTNLTNLSNMTKQIFSRSDHTLTKQYFNSVILDMKQNSVNPVQALPTYLATAALNGNNHNTHDEPTPHDCEEVKRNGFNTSGVYRIHPDLANQPFFVYCEMETRGGGWTVIHNRFEGTVDFYKEWQDYKHGFGNLGGEFWLGLEKIHVLTNHEVNELLVELQDFNLANAYAYYSAFAVGTEVEGYPISFLGSYEGDAGDSLVYHAGMKFSTRDIDQDNWPDGSCAESHIGAWWYNGCDTSNLNGRYLNGQLPQSYEYQGMYWYDWHGPGYSLMKARILIRPRYRNVNETRPETEEKPEKADKKPKSKKKDENEVLPDDYVVDPDVHEDNYEYGNY